MENNKLLDTPFLHGGFIVTYRSMAECVEMGPFPKVWYDELWQVVIESRNVEGKVELDKGKLRWLLKKLPTPVADRREEPDRILGSRYRDENSYRTLVVLRYQTYDGTTLLFQELGHQFFYSGSPSLHIKEKDFLAIVEPVRELINKETTRG